MVNSEIILKIVEDLNSQKFSNVNIIAKNYNIFYFMLQNCFKNKIVSHNKIYFKPIIFFIII